MGKTTKKKTGRRATSAETDAGDSETLAELLEQARQQTRLLELILCCEARRLQITEGQHRLEYAGASRDPAPDTHGLGPRVESALTDAAMRSTLLTSTEGLDDDDDDTGEGGDDG